MNTEPTDPLAAVAPDTTCSVVCPHCGHKITPVVSEEWRQKSSIGGKKAALHPNREKGSPNNRAAIRWNVVSPKGKLYSFKNLNGWCRRNEHLFEDNRPESKQPLWERARNGIGQLKRTNKGSSWFGWSLADINEKPA